jgi:hypothetical protein
VASLSLTAARPAASAGDTAKADVAGGGVDRLGLSGGGTVAILHSVIDDPAITHFYPTVQAAVAAAQKST